MYRYETHLHTVQGSACGASTGAEHVRHYKAMGYQGIFVTDHFFGGNTAAPRTGKWKDRIDWFCSGFEDAWNEGQKVGLDVFFGWEENFNGDEYLIYGLDKQFMLDHPEMEHWTRREQYEQVHAAGGCVIQAPPFRMRDYLSAIHICTRYTDGVEVANAGNPPVQDAFTARYAKVHGLYTTAGSDNHRSKADTVLFGVGLDKRIDSVDEWVAHILNREPHTLLCDPARFDADVSQTPLLPSYLLNEKDEFEPLNMSWLNN